MAYLDRDGVKIYYEVHGSGGRTPLLLSHGYSASGQMWNGNLAALADERQVVTWDLRGHGRSDSPADPGQYSEALSVKDMSALLDQIGAETAVVGGLSLGGYLSLAFHLQWPERVAALLLCDTGPGYRRAEPREEWNAMAIRWAEGFERDGLGALSSGAEVQASEHTSAQGLALASRGILTQHDSQVLDSLASIAVPTLVLVGSEDRSFLGAAEMMAAKIPGATKVVLEGAGHAANIDRPAAFDSAVLDFLGTV